MTRIATFSAALALLIGAGCTIDVPFEPGQSDLAKLLEELQSDFEGWVDDPFGIKPFPVLIGGDSLHVYYATSLTDVRLRFKGQLPDVVFPSFLGPSNLYVYADGGSELLRPLIPTGAFAGITTDGGYLAYVRLTSLAEPPDFRVIASDLDSGTEQVLYDSTTASAELRLAPNPLMLSDGRLVFVLHDAASGTDRIRLVDLTGAQGVREIEVAAFYGGALRANWLAYAERVDQTVRIVLRDLTTDSSQVVAPEVRGERSPAVFLTNNAVVWEEALASGAIRVVRYDIPAVTTRVWVDAAAGELRGATDEHFVTEELVYVERSGAKRIIVRQYDSQGQEKELADFRADGLAGQTHVIGDRAAWVTPNRKVVLVPLAGGERISFKPF